MTVYGVRGSHLGLIARSSVRNGIRHGTGLVFTFLTLFAGLVIASAFLSPIENLEKATKKGQLEGSTRELLDMTVETIGKPAIRWALDASDEQVDYLVDEKPAIVSAILVVLLFSIPFLVSLGAFNQLAGDIGSKGIRYLLLRTERANLFLGRFIGTFLFSLVVLGILMGILLLYLVFKADFYPSGKVALWMVQGYLAIALLSMPYVALCAWFSAATDSAGVSLLLNQLVIGFVPLFVHIGTMAEPRFKYAGYVMPWAFKYELLHPSFLHWLGAAGAMFGFTALFLFIGMRTFQRRDL